MTPWALYALDKVTRTTYCEAVRHPRFGSRNGEQHAAKTRRRAKRKATGR